MDNIRFFFNLLLFIFVSPFVAITCLLFHDEMGFKEAFISLVDIIFN